MRSAPLNCFMPSLNRNSSSNHNRNPACFGAGFFVVVLFLAMAGLAQGLETGRMKAPKSALISPSPEVAGGVESSMVRSALLGSVRFFQKRISPIDGPRCSFSPTCSQFGHEAVHDHGPLLGVVMTADRLMRCTYWTTSGPDYLRLPNGALSDPVAKNLMSRL